MCDVIERIESFGIDLEQLVGVSEKPGSTTGDKSAYSITLIVLGVVEDEWRRRSQGTRDGNRDSSN